MANTSSSINVLALDFATLKNQLITYLQSQEQFKDYNFTGPNLAMLLSLLSYNAFQHGFYSNMLASEMFLDSAQLRDSIVSHAKDLNYTPRSNLSATANVNIKITTADGTTGLVIPKYTSFTGRIGSNSYTFTTNTVIAAVSSNSTITANNVTVYEGIINTDQFVVNYANSSQRFIISEAGVDTSSLYLNVLEDGGSSLIPYSEATSLFGLGANSAVFFVQAAQNGQYEIIFGDGVTGRLPKDGAIVVAEYRVSSGDAPNQIAAFRPNATIAGQANIAVMVNAPAQGGSYAESISSIKFNAPRAFATQERAVTTEDYETLLKQNFPELIAVSAVGGEDVDPPQFGSVIIAVALENVDLLPDSKRAEYLNFIKPRSPLTVSPQFINPDRLYVGVNSTVNYNINITSADASFIQAAVSSVIQQYNSQYLDNFKVNLRYSQLVRFIDGSDPSIISNETALTMIKRIQPVLATPTNYVLDFGQAISDILTTSQESAISSTTFTYNNKICALADDGKGGINLLAISSGSKTPLFNVGTVDYVNGVVSLTNLKIDSLDTSFVKVYAVPAQKDIASSQSAILSIDPNEVTITAIQLAE